METLSLCSCLGPLRQTFVFAYWHWRGILFSVPTISAMLQWAASLTPTNAAATGSAIERLDWERNDGPRNDSQFFRLVAFFLDPA
jgi:hypothetical protein